MNIRMLKQDNVFIIINENGLVEGFQVERSLKNKNNNNPFDFLLAMNENIYLSKVKFGIKEKESYSYYLAYFNGTIKVVETENFNDYYFSSLADTEKILITSELSNKEKRKKVLDSFKKVLDSDKFDKKIIELEIA